jgi:hypothetical protein
VRPAQRQDCACSLPPNQRRSDFTPGSLQMVQTALKSSVSLAPQRCFSIFNIFRTYNHSMGTCRNKADADIRSAWPVNRKSFLKGKPPIVITYSHIPDYLDFTESSQTHITSQIFDRIELWQRSLTLNKRLPKSKRVSMFAASLRV